MAFWDGLTASFEGSLMSNLLLGAAAVVVAPIVMPVVLAGVRPVAKTLIKGGVYVYDTARGIVAEAGEQLGDLVAEAHAELTTSTTAPQKSADQRIRLWRPTTCRFSMLSPDACASKSAC